MKLKIVSFLIMANVLFCHGQGFVNTGFESATLVPISGDPQNRVQFAQAFQGWSATVGGLPLTSALTNNVFLDTAGIAIINRSWSNSPAYTLGFLPYGLIQGNFTAILMSGTLTNTQTGVDTSLYQSAVVPVGTQSLLFSAIPVFDSFGAFTVTMNGQDLSLTIVSNALNYTIYGADVSAWAGQTAQLSFNVLGYSPQGSSEYLYLDSIQFSPTSVPEPSAFALIVIGISILGSCRLKRIR